MDRDTVVQLAPHYLVMFALVLIAIRILEALAGDLGLLVRFVAISVIVFSYRPVVLRLGLAPDAWE